MARPSSAVVLNVNCPCKWHCTRAGSDRSTLCLSATPSSTMAEPSVLGCTSSQRLDLIKFDLSRLPAVTTSSQVTKATVKLYTSAVAGQGAFDLYRIDGTWKRAPSLTATARPRYRVLWRCP